MKELGLKTYRFSLSRARTTPTGDDEVNQAGIDFYNAVIDTLSENDILPFVTLYHFDLPFALVKKYNGWADRRCASTSQRYTQVCYQAFGDRVRNWQVTNEQNLMICVGERMNMYDVAPENIEKIRARMDYHMFVAHALTTSDHHQLVARGKVGPSVSSTMTYPSSNKPEDI